jgi:plasmid replication initiation protein
MKKKELTENKVSLVQPNKVTNARYDYTEVQENVLTCMIEAIQDHMTKEKPIETDLFGHPTIRIKASEIAKGNTKLYVLQQLRELRKKDIDFEYINDKGQTEDVTTGLISSFRSIRETDFIEVEISVWAIPFLLYWGKGVGGTVFSKTIALTLKGVYTKRLYKFCKRWEDVGGKAMDLDEFKQMLMVEGKYKKPADLKRFVLEPAKKQMAKHADVCFKYEFKKIRSRSYNSISFKIFSTKAGRKQDNTGEWYKFVYLFLCRTYPNYKNDTAQRITDELATDQLQLRRIYKRFSELDDDLTKGKIDNGHMNALTKKILKEDYNIK